MSRTSVMKALSVMMLAALMVFGLSLSAYAVSGETEASALLFTYYDVRSVADGGLGLTDNYYTIASTSDDWVQAHVRIRTGKTSVELLDFDLLLSPNDVFTFDLYEGAGGAMTFASCDKKTLLNSGFNLNVGDCFVVDTNTDLGNGAKMTSLISQCEGVDAAAANNESKKGYVEVIVEGKVPTCSASGAGKYVCGENGDTFCESSESGRFNIIANAACEDSGKPAACCTGAGTGTCDEAKTLLNSNTDLSLDDHCNVFRPTPVLIGKQYYAKLEGGVVAQMAAVNGEAINDFQRPIFHFESFDAEANSSACVGVDAADCYAYTDADTTTSIAAGADDLNNCYFQDTLLVNGTPTGVVNKFGAGATFGPTIADLYSRRDGTLATTAANLSAAANGLGESRTTNIEDADTFTEMIKDRAESHYFNAPAPIPVDVLTSFAIVFPLQHFIGESDKVSVGPVFDLEENVKSTPITKFISPGLPSPPSLFEEASLFTPAYPFVEGYIQMSVSASNKTKGAFLAPACTDPGATTKTTDCYVCNDHDTDCKSLYSPAYTGLAITHGANFMTTTPLHYDSSRSD